MYNFNDVYQYKAHWLLSYWFLCILTCAYRYANMSPSDKEVNVEYYILRWPLRPMCVLLSSFFYFYVVGETCKLFPSLFIPWINVTLTPIFQAHFQCTISMYLFSISAINWCVPLPPSQATITITYIWAE